MLHNSTAHHSELHSKSYSLYSQDSARRHATGILWSGHRQHPPHVLPPLEFVGIDEVERLGDAGVVVIDTALYGDNPAVEGYSTPERQRGGGGTLLVSEESHNGDLQHSPRVLKTVMKCREWVAHSISM